MASILIGSFSLTGCSSTAVEEYSDYQPRMVPEEFFSGKLTAHGIVKDWSGKVIRYFNADINAFWKNGVGILEENFLFNDGEEQKRVWTLSPAGSSQYTATAGDVIGTGQARTAGNSMFLNYVLRIPYKDSTMDLTVDDRMYLVNKTTLINESKLKKFGITVGQIQLVITKQ